MKSMLGEMQIDTTEMQDEQKRSKKGAKKEQKRSSNQLVVVLAVWQQPILVQQRYRTLPISTCFAEYRSGIMFLLYLFDIFFVVSTVAFYLVFRWRKAKQVAGNIP